MRPIIGTEPTGQITSELRADDLMQPGRVNGLAYTDPAVFEAELERIFTSGWVFVGHESEVPAAGDFVTRRLGLDPVIMVRDRGGDVHVMANRCSHRGVTLCQHASGNTGSFACIFHGWTYGLDGALRGVPQPGGMCSDRETLGLNRPGQVASYRGFVFANASGDAGSLDEHLGPGGIELLDWACDLSPVGELQISAGWLGQRVSSNWKMWAESDLDGYHLGRLHASLWRVVPGSQYEAAVLAGENVVTATTRDRGRGHVELEFWRGYDRQLAWLGVERGQVADYCEALIARHGSDRAEELLWQGPPHALIFPNLFLGEMNLAIIDPLAPGLTVHHHTPLLLGGVSPEFNRRVLRQSEAAMGPAGFLLPDDATAAERMQIAFGHSGGWMDLSRGMDREQVDARGDRIGHVSDEVTTRGFWRHWAELMATS
ncbi:MAG TPA: Rieske 2Fe-2S domain-containing protein [Ilumatobacteraceae bacterium]|nr:Rieske 2Fe-2S domain-containing protein [Ilumatobacteraceae bacterium]